MNQFVIDDPGLGRVEFRDRKRYLWLLSVIIPLLPLLGVALWFTTESTFALAVPLLFAYVCIPALDYLFGADTSNPPEAIVPQLEADHYYRVLTYIAVPLHFVTLIVLAWFVGSHDLSGWAVLITALTAGSYSGLGLNTAHELGHKKTRFEQALARVGPGCSGVMVISALSTIGVIIATWPHRRIRPAHAWVNPSTHSRFARYLVHGAEAGRKSRGV